MSITAIGRNFNGDPNFVFIVTDNDLTEITTTGFWNLPATKDSVAALQNGEWEWQDTDLVVIHYDSTLVGFFTYDAVNSCFDELSPTGGLANTLQSANIFVGNVSNIATGVAVSGDITMSNTGVVAIAAGVIVNADINAAAAIAYSKLATMATGSLLLGNAGTPTATAMSGDATIGATGVLTIAASAITTAKILNANVTLGKLSSGITPKGVIKQIDFAVTIGGSATEIFAYPGIENEDWMFAQMVNNGTNNVTIISISPGVDQFTVVFSGNPGNDTQFYFMSLRAPS